MARNKKIKKQVIIIGSGFGGLALACRLQARGFSVTVLEKNSQVGGHASRLQKKGYTFDMGPSLITAPSIIQSTFALAGKNIHDYITLIPLDPFYRIYFHDKTYIDYSSNTERMKANLNKFSADDANAYEHFVDYTKKVYDAVIGGGIGAHPFYLKNLARFIPTALRLGLLFPVYHQASRYFRDFRSRFTFSFHPLFVGGNPFNTPSVYLLIHYLEKNEGVLFSSGGMYSLVQAYEKLFTEMGGTIHTNHEVTEILVEGRKANGVRVKNKTWKADIIVSNAHFAHTYKDLINERHRKKWTDNKVQSLDYSMSCVVLYLGVKKQYPQLLQHTLILSPRYKSLVEDLFIHKKLPGDFSLYVHAPTRTDPSMAPSGCESMYILIPTPNLKMKNANWNIRKKDFTKKILDYLEHDFGLTDLQNSLEVCETFTPEDFQNQRNNYLGACWSLEPHLLQSANFRPHNKSEEFDNVYLVGASTHPGAGVPGVLLSAEATEYAIQTDFS